MHKVLIADDNKDFAELLESLLTTNGYKTHVVFDGLEAIEHLKNTQDYDLIITDVIMPHGDGFDLIDFARKELDVKIIAISGGGILSSAENTINTLTGQADACLGKPVKMSELLKTVREVLSAGN